jgi:hypothetical protein
MEKNDESKESKRSDLAGDAGCVTAFVDVCGLHAPDVARMPDLSGR